MSSKPKITRACINPPGKDTRDRYNEEWVELEVGSASDLSGYVVDHLIDPRTKRQAWSTYYRFGDGESFSAGARVVIHSGAGEDRGDGNVFHRFVAKDEERGQWRLNNDGDSVRMLDPDGTKVDEKAFTGGEGYCSGKDGGAGPQKKPQTQYA